MLPLKEFNRCRAYAFPLCHFKLSFVCVVKVRGSAALQPSQLGFAFRLAGSLCMMGSAGVQPLHDGNRWGAAALWGPVLRGWVIHLLEYVFRQETHLFPWSWGECCDLVGATAELFLHLLRHC